MNNNDIKIALDTLNILTADLESMYEENGGEITDEITSKEEEMAAIQVLLTTEGADSLGRWLKAKEDEKKALKAEKDFLTRRMAAIDGCIDYIKGQMYCIMVLTEQDKVKGQNGYSFTKYVSETVAVNKDILKENYSDRVEKAIREAGVPAYVGVTLTASSTAAKEGVEESDQGMFVKSLVPTVKFMKPRANKE